MAGSGGQRSVFRDLPSAVVVVAGRFVGSCERADFQKTGRLAPAVALHMIYNLVVLW